MAGHDVPGDGGNDGYRCVMRCPTCGDLRDRVVDSRQAEDGSFIRRRRECEGCGRRSTTFERLETVPVVVRKRAGHTEPFDPTKAATGLALACKGRPVEPARVADLVGEVEDVARAVGPEVTSDFIGKELLLRLRSLDRVAALRFASVYKSFEDIDDFEREISLLGDPSAAG